MIFKGVAPDIRYCDPQYYEFQFKLYMQHTLVQFDLFGEEVRKAFARMNLAFKAAGESMKRFTQYLPKDN